MIQTNWALKFREAAAIGDNDLLKSIYKTYPIDINEPGLKSKQTAVHRAANGGHVQTLRLLYNLGADFFCKDLKNLTPQQLAKEIECQQIFELIVLAKKTLEIVNEIIPRKLIGKESVKNNNSFRKWRKKMEVSHMAIAQSKLNGLTETLQNDIKSGDCQEMTVLTDWLKTCVMSVNYFCNCYHNLSFAIDKNQQYGACGENSGIAFAYLTAEAKTTFSVDAIMLDESNENHSIVLLNLNQKQWYQSLIIDALFGRSFFYENLDQVPNLPFNIATLQKSYVIIGSLPVRFPTNTLRPIKTISELQMIIDQFLKDISAKFAEINKKKLNYFSI